LLGDRSCHGFQQDPPIDATPAPKRQQAAKAIKALPAGDILLVVVLGVVWADSESWSSASFDDMILSSRSVFNSPASML
jgi:hypothetical protein